MERSLVEAKSREADAQAVRHVLTGVRSSTAAIKEREDANGLWIEVIPAEVRHCSFSMAFADYGCYYLTFGHGAYFEDLSSEAFPPHHVALAILDGRVEEDVWFKRGRPLVVRGEIALSSGTVLSSKTGHSPLAMLGFGKKQRITYEAYPR
jgi:hypothetical protein